MRLEREAEDSDATFSPAVNDRSLRMALAKQIRELHDKVPASQRLSAARALPAPTPGVLLILLCLHHCKIASTAYPVWTRSVLPKH